MRALPLTRAPRSEHLLHGLPRLAIYQWLMRPDILHPLEGNDPFIVGQMQNVLQSGRCDRLGWPRWRRRCRQPQLCQMLRQPPHRPIPRRILCESQPHQWCALLIQGDGADFSAVFVSGADVHVAERCLTQRSAVSGFLSHPLDDLIREIPTVELGDGAHDAVQQHAARGLVDVLRRRYQPHTGLFEGPVDLYIVRPITSEAIQLVDDDVVNPAVFFEVRQHLLQLRPVSRPGGLTAVGELLDDQRAHRLSLALIRFTLSGEGKTFFTATALGLLPGGDADV